MTIQTAEKIDQTGFVKTLNNMGFMTSDLDPYSQMFVDNSVKTHLPCLDIGCAFGVASIPALANGAKIIANDIDPRHLEILKNNVPISQRRRLKLASNIFPEDLHFEEESLGAVLACRVFHFLTGDRIDIALSNIYKWLAPGASLYIICETPYLGNVQSFWPTYEQRKESGYKWPGEITNFNKIDKRFGFNLPEFMHLLDVDILQCALESHGFEVDQIGYISRENFPNDIKFDGRESVGAIARKV